jgi:cytochrome c oxidase assembly factor CtaG
MLPAFGWQAALEHWEFAPAVTAIVAAAALLYLWGAWRVGRRHPARPWPWTRTAFFLGGLLVVVLATQSGIGAYDDVLFWVHMIQHLMLIMIAPPLLVAGQPVTLLLHASRNPLHTWTKRAVRSRPVTFLTWPPFAFVAYTAVIAVTHLTGFVTLTLTNQAAHDAEHALYLVVGFLFFLPVIGWEPIRWRLSHPVRFILLALAMPVDTFTGVVLGTETTVPAGTPTVRPPGSPSPVQDLHWAGAIMWVGGDAIMFGFMMLVFGMWARTADRAGTRGGGWLEAARTANFDHLVQPSAVAAGASPPAGTATPSGSGAATPSGSGAATPSGSGAATPAVAGAATPGGAGSGTPARSGAPVRPVPGGGLVAGPDGTIDDDEHLAAYNAYLARLNQSGHGPAR